MLWLCHGDDNDDDNDDDVTHMRLFLRALCSDCSLSCCCNLSMALVASSFSAFSFSIFCSDSRLFQEYSDDNDDKESKESKDPGNDYKYIDSIRASRSFARIRACFRFRWWRTEQIWDINYDYKNSDRVLFLFFRIT